MESNRREYLIKKKESRDNWHKKTGKAIIDNFPWGPLSADDFRPHTGANVAYNSDSLFVYMETDDPDLLAMTKDFGHVHTDCCMEFFLSPSPESKHYLNWEFNPAGGMYLSIGTSRYDRVPAAKEDYRNLFQVKTSGSQTGWNIEYRIPLAFLRTFFPSLELKQGHSMRGNFYKCGDKCARPHYGCWSPIDLPKPDFHCPDFFGVLKLE